MKLLVLSIIPKRYWRWFLSDQEIAEFRRELLFTRTCLNISAVTGRFPSTVRQQVARASEKSGFPPQQVADQVYMVVQEGIEFTAALRMYYEAAEQDRDIIKQREKAEE